MTETVLACPLCEYTCSKPASQQARELRRHLVKSHKKSERQRAYNQQTKPGSVVNPSLELFESKATFWLPQDTDDNMCKFLEKNFPFANFTPFDPVKEGGHDGEQITGMMEGDLVISSTNKSKWFVVFQLRRGAWSEAATYKKTRSEYKFVTV